MIDKKKIESGLYEYTVEGGTRYTVRKNPHTAYRSQTWCITSNDGTVQFHAFTLDDAEKRIREANPPKAAEDFRREATANVLTKTPDELKGGAVQAIEYIAEKYQLDNIYTRRILDAALELDDEYAGREKYRTLRATGDRITTHVSVELTADGEWLENVHQYETCDITGNEQQLVKLPDDMSLADYGAELDKVGAISHAMAEDRRRFGKMSDQQRERWTALQDRLSYYDSQALEPSDDVITQPRRRSAGPVFGKVDNPVFEAWMIFGHDVPADSPPAENARAKCRQAITDDVTRRYETAAAGMARLKSADR